MKKRGLYSLVILTLSILLISGCGISNQKIENNIVENISEKNLSEAQNQTSKETSKTEVEQKELNKEIEKIIEDYKKDPDLNLSKSIEKLPNTELSSNHYIINNEKVVDKSVTEKLESQRWTEVTVTLYDNVGGVLLELGQDFQLNEDGKSENSIRGNISKEGVIKLLNNNYLRGIFGPVKAGVTLIESTQLINLGLIIGVQNQINT